MSAIDCGREQELLDALSSSRWPTRCDPELRAHVEACAVCADTLAVALLLLTEGHVAYASARVPSSGTVWWRAQMRARQEAARAASRPITIVQTIAFTCGAALITVAAFWARPSLPSSWEWLQHLAGSVRSGAAWLASVESLSPPSLLPWIVLAMWLVLAPVAIYLAVDDD